MNKIAAATLALGLVLSACGDDEPEVSAAPVLTETSSETTTQVAAETSDATDEELAIEFAECMRDGGVDFPNPVVNADGSIDLIPAGNGGLDIDSPQFDAAVETCGPIIEGASFLPGADLDEAEQQDTLLAFAECLRDLGYDVDDPNLSELQASGPGGIATIFGDGFDPQDPANAGAVQQCQTVVLGGAS